MENLVKISEALIQNSQQTSTNFNPSSLLHSNAPQNFINSFNTHLEDSNSTKKKKNAVRMRFSPQEDQNLIRLVSIYGDQDWKKISTEISKTSHKVKRTSRQCKDRYINYLSPEIKNSQWTMEEDQCLIFHYLLTPYHWRSMTNLFPGRSEVSIKNRFNHLYKNGMRLLKPIIENSIPRNNLNQTMIKDLPNSNDDSISKSANQFLQQFNINKNSLKSVIDNLFNHDPTLINKFLLANQNQNNKNSSTDNNSNNNPQNSNDGNHNSSTDFASIFSQQANFDEILQLESDSEYFDPLSFLEMYH